MDISKIYREDGVGVEDAEEWRYIEFLTVNFGVEVERLNEALWKSNRKHIWVKRGDAFIGHKLYPHNRYRIKL